MDTEHSQVPELMDQLGTGRWPGAGAAFSSRPASELTAAGGGPGQLDPDDLDDIVTAVVDRLERRVLDEFDRRGHTRGPGVF